MKKTLYKHLLFFLFLFISFSLLSVYIISNFKLVYFCDDRHILKLICSLSIACYAFIVLLFLIIKKDSLNFIAFIAFYICEIPIVISLLILKYINTKYLILYAVANALVIILTCFAVTKKRSLLKEYFFVPGLMLVVMFSVITSLVDSTDNIGYIQFENIVNTNEMNIVDKTDDMALHGTFGTYFEQTVYTNGNGFSSLTFMQLKAKESALADAFIKQYNNGNMTTIADNSLVNITWDCADTYILRFKTNDVVCVLESNQASNEIVFNNSIV